MNTPTFDNLVFAGGGNRCFWQAGFWSTLAQETSQAPSQIASVSAGAAISCALFAGKIEETLANTLETMAVNEKNRYWKNLFSKDPIHPHSRLYRQIVAKSIDEDSLKKLKEGPINRILVAHIPRWLGPRSAVLMGLSAYQLEKKLRHPVHPSFGRKLGFQSEFISSQDCHSVEDLTDVLISSSCTPPFTPLMFRNKAPVLDGGMVDNVPLHGILIDKTEARGPEAQNSVSGEQTLVLLSRPYKYLPVKNGVTYIQPSKPVAASSWDYTNPLAVEQTYKQGIEDAYRFLKIGTS